MSVLAEIAIFLLAAVTAVPLFKRLGLGAVLGYLFAGIAIGPWGLRLITDVEEIFHFAELGVVFLLFVIGLELQLSRLWVLRRPILGMGGTQLLMTAVVISPIAVAFGLPVLTAIVIAVGLSMSSTAFGLQTLAEQKQLSTQHGRAAFAILLFQDVAVIPLLALIPLLGVVPDGLDAAQVLAGMGKAVVLIGAVILFGHYLLRPLFRVIAWTRVPEVFTAGALLVVVGTALLMDWAGLSMALGSFLAGVLLADSEYRHEVEANVEPFKGILLGLFFIAVGMSVDLQLVVSEAARVLAMAAGLIAVKFAVLYAVGRGSGQTQESAMSLAAALSQGGEFAFVLFGIAVTSGVLEQPLADLLIAVVTLSMASTPVLLRLVLRWSAGRAAGGPRRDFDRIDEAEPRVIIAGFGRFGQIVGRLLQTLQIPFTALEPRAEQVDFVRRFGNKVYFGDASRLDVLRTARPERARLLVIALSDAEVSVKTAELVKRHYPNLRVYARARNRQHAYRLMAVGVDYVIRETLLSSLALAQEVLVGLGWDTPQAARVVERFREHDERLLQEQRHFSHDEAQLIASARQAAQELEDLFERDAKLRSETENESTNG